MNIDELMDKYDKCIKSICIETYETCDKCEFNMPDDIWNACREIKKYLEKINATNES